MILLCIQESLVTFVPLWKDSLVHGSFFVSVLLLQGPQSSAEMWSSCCGKLVYLVWTMFWKRWLLSIYLLDIQMLR